MNEKRVSVEELYPRFLDSKGLTTDSRHVKQGEIFLAIRGENFNGNSYALTALDKGASFAIVDDAAVAKADKRCLLVKDTTEMLALLANFHRRTIGTPLLLITGTNGKTTTKELVAAVLRKRVNVLATEGNYNNHLGLPLTLLRLSYAHEFAVIEAGASHVGEIAFLARIAEPNYGLITNVGRAHLEGFGSFEGVLQAKTELFDYLRVHKGTAIVHGEDPLLFPQSEGLKRILYSSEPASWDIVEEPTVSGFIDDEDDHMQLAFTLQIREERLPIKTQLVGRYNMVNALAAAAIGVVCGIAPNEIAAALEEYTPSNHRSQLTGPTKARNWVIADVYNANPSSMQTALHHYLDCPTRLKRAVLLGDMLELGKATKDEHRKIIELIANIPLSTSPLEAYFVGTHFASFESEFSDKPNLLFFPSKEALLVYLTSHPIEGRLLLLKASHGMHFEELLSKL